MNEVRVNKVEATSWRRDNLEQMNIWKSLVDRQRVGNDLTPEQVNILTIRSLCLSIATYWNSLLDGPQETDGPREARNRKRRYDADIHKLKTLGIKARMNEGAPGEKYSDPRFLVESVAGQVMSISEHGGDRGIATKSEMTLLLKQELAEGDPKTDERTRKLMSHTNLHKLLDFTRRQLAWELGSALQVSRPGK